MTTDTHKTFQPWTGGVFENAPLVMPRGGSNGIDQPDTMPTGIDIEAMAKQVRAKVDPAVLSLIASMLTDRAAGIVERMALAKGEDGMPEWGEEVRRFAIEAGAAIRAEVG